MSTPKLSLQMMVFFSSLPIVIGTSVVSFKVYRMFTQEDPRLARSTALISTVHDAKESMVSMSEALRGYLLDPKAAKEMERKLAADDNFVKSMEKLDGLIQDSPDLLVLRKEMSEFDKNELDKAENMVGDLVKKDLGDAQDAYSKVYSPLRKQQEARFEKLQALVEAKAAKIHNEISSEKTQNGAVSILWILGSSAMGLLCMFWALGRASKRLSQEVLTLKNSGAQLLDSCNSMGGVSEELSQSTSEQAAAIQESVSALSEMTSMIQQTSESAKKSLQVSKNVEERSQVGQDIMKRMVDSMTAIDQTNQSLQQIAQIIQSINVKANVINDIVFKTQLLSFNASIEAARAGQYGKGFSVVAEEVGNLAQMSGASAKEIETLLADSQKQVGATLALIRQRVSESKIVTDESVRTFNEIALGIREVTGQVKSISDATNQQSVGIEQTQKAISQLDQMARKNSETAQQTLHATQKVRTIASDLDTSRCAIQSIVMGSGAVAGAASPAVTRLSPPATLDDAEAPSMAPEELSADDSSFNRAA